MSFVAPLILLRIWFGPKDPSVRIHRSLSGIRKMLHPPPHGKATRTTQLAARAAANRLLASAFGLTNTFVRNDIETNAAFRCRAGDLIAHTDWLRLLHISKAAVDASVLDLADSAPFDEFVQIATLRFIICGLLLPDIGPAMLDGDALRAIGSLITTIWVSLKDKDSSSAIDNLRAQLHTHLDALPAPVELDLLIPTWETFWRVVATTVANVEQDVDARTTFSAFLQAHDVAEQSRVSREHNLPSVFHYVLECLRLYPPVSHIKRAGPAKNMHTLSLITQALSLFPRNTIDIADIERAHRSAAVWGPDPTIFDASRFLRDPERTKDVLAFGHGPLKCIAANWAPTAVAVVVAAILDTVDGVHYRLEHGPRVGGRVGWDGWRLVNLEGRDGDLELKIM
ncbi:hypothetical protein HMN09_00114700 [Mycena chlorophos]|uniref:Cytochrome P450 n=1 Tax=Mycena chlorophos TaxID=658473 RepID=A0A8H6TQJ1_MYCCL|nr:hypothetical protein HMN09_00114700 [Mycena chlorophos]